MLKLLKNFFFPTFSKRSLHFKSYISLNVWSDYNTCVSILTEKLNDEIVNK